MLSSESGSTVRIVRSSSAWQQFSGPLGTLGLIKAARYASLRTIASTAARSSPASAAGWMLAYGALFSFASLASQAKPWRLPHSRNLGTLASHAFATVVAFVSLVALPVPLVSLVAADGAPRALAVVGTVSGFAGALVSVLACLMTMSSVASPYVRHSSFAGSLVLLIALAAGVVARSSTQARLSSSYGGSHAGERVFGWGCALASAFCLFFAAITGTLALPPIFSWFPVASFFLTTADFNVERFASRHVSSSAAAMTTAAATGIAALLSAPAFDWAAAGLYVVGLGLCYPDEDTEQAEKVEQFVGLPAGGGAGGDGVHDGMASGSAHAYSYDHFRNAANAFAAEPMYTYWHFLRSTYHHIWEDDESRSIATFLAINLSFMFVEFVYGVWSNSLGLISDAFHMAFDCVALAIGLAAAVISRWPPNRSYTYGYERVQVLSGFVNGIFLVFVAVFVLWESVERVLEPPDVNTDRLLLVSVLGLVVNMIGLYSFSAVHDKAHGHSHSHDHGHSHGHGHGDDEHGGGGGSFNLSGVFLHVLADTLGSVGVIISSLLIQFFGWHVADPICSLCIAGLIFLSVVPLVRETIGILLLRTPADKARSLSDAMSQLLALPGVAGYSDPLFWLAHGEHVVGSVKLQLDDGPTREADVLASASAIFRARGVREMTLQVERRTSSSPYPMRSPPDPTAFQSYQRGAIPLFSPDNPLNPRAGGFSLDSLATLANAVSRGVQRKKKEKL